MKPMGRVSEGYKACKSEVAKGRDIRRHEKKGARQEAKKDILRVLETSD